MIPRFTELGTEKMSKDNEIDWILRNKDESKVKFSERCSIKINYIEHMAKDETKKKFISSDKKEDFNSP